MADIGSNIPRAGNPNNSTQAADQDTLFLQVFSGEVLTAFEEANVMRELHTVRTISEGKKIRFYHIFSIIFQMIKNRVF